MKQISANDTPTFKKGQIVYMISFSKNQPNHIKIVMKEIHQVYKNHCMLKKIPTPYKKEKLFYSFEDAYDCLVKQVKAIKGPSL